MGDSSLPRSPRKAMLLPLIANIKGNVKYQMKHVKTQEVIHTNGISAASTLPFILLLAPNLLQVI